MKKIYFFLKENWQELLSSMSAVVTTWLSIYVKNDFFNLVFSVSTIILLLLLVVLLKKKEKKFYYLPMQKRDDIQNWLGSGKYEYKPSLNSFYVGHNDPGHIFAPTLNWSNYSFKFQFKIEHACIGAVVRAVNLSNFIMLQIREDGIRPHIKINGSYKTFEINETGFSFSKNLSKDEFYDCNIRAENNQIFIKISLNKNIIFQRVWNIPQGSMLFEFRENNEDAKPKASIPFPINLEYGSVGFRNSSNEAGVVKNVLIEKL